MTTIITRSGKGAALTHTEVDANFTNLNADKAEVSAVILATQKGAASGVAPLDATSKISSTYLPSYVDDVLEYANYAALPATGETGKIYVALDTNKTYRWSGSAYIYITSGAVDSVAGKTGVVTLDKTDVGLGNVDNTTDASKPVSTATQTALDLKAPISSPTFTGATTISVTDNTNAALRITQLGTGNALVVEDSANPDSTPFMIDASGNVGIGVLPAFANNKLSIAGSGVDAQSWLVRYSADANGYDIRLLKTRSTNIYAQSVVQSGDLLGALSFGGDDGSVYRLAASITAVVDGTPGTNDMPGRLVFNTTADGASSPTERMRIDNAGRVGIGGIPSGIARISIGGVLPSGSTSVGQWNFASVNPSLTTSVAHINYASNDVSAGTLPSLFYNSAVQGAFTGTVTNQYGFNASSNLTGATNNFGFYGNIPSGTGRYNLYMAGTADNYLAGSLGIGISPVTAVGVYIAQTTTASSAYGILNSQTASAATTTSLRGFQSSINTAASAFTLGSLSHYYATQGSFGAGSSVSYQIGFDVNGSLTGATNNYGFYGAIASGTGRYNLYMGGTADNYLAGSLGIGGTPYAGNALNIQKTLTGATTAQQVNAGFTINSDVTTVATAFSSYPATQAAAFTLPILKHFSAAQGAIGAGSTVTGQYGFTIDNSLVGATNNYGFYGNIPAGTGRYNLYMGGTADNYLAGSLGIGAAPYAGVDFVVAKSVTGGTTRVGASIEGIVQSDVTNLYIGQNVTLKTAAATFTCANVQLYRAFQATLGVNSNVTTQVGFITDASLTGATNNYAFYGVIPAGTGRYNLFMAGTADNYMAGNLGIGTTSPSTKLTVAGSITITGANALRGSYGAGAIMSNFAAGDGALASNTTGANNTASGFQTLFSNTTGANNTVSGVNALYYNTTGANNTASGVNALQNNTTGVQNTASGVNALYSNTTGNYNTASGVQALYSNTTGSGNSAFNPLNSAGTYAPVFNPTTENNRFCMGSTGVTNAYIQVAWTVVSDARDKTNFAPVPHGLDFVNQLQPTAYQFKENRETDVATGIVRYGFKAQDVLALEGDSPVIIDNEDLDKLRFNESSLIPVLVNAIKELTARLELLEGK